MRGLAQEPEASAPPGQGPAGQRQVSVLSVGPSVGSSNTKGLPSSGTKNFFPLPEHEKKTMSYLDRGNGYIYFNKYFLSTYCVRENMPGPLGTTKK